MGEKVDKLWKSHAMNVSSQNNGLLNNTPEYRPHDIK